MDLIKNSIERSREDALHIVAQTINIVSNGNYGSVAAIILVAERLGIVIDHTDRTFLERSIK